MKTDKVNFTSHMYVTGTKDEIMRIRTLIKPKCIEDCFGYCSVFTNNGLPNKGGLFESLECNDIEARWLREGIDAVAKKAKDYYNKTITKPETYFKELIDTSNNDHPCQHYTASQVLDAIRNREFDFEALKRHVDYTCFEIFLSILFFKS